jgi:auxin influx carrier (AUX1 LAX family)
MASEKVETIVAGNYMEMERDVGGGGDHGDDQPGGEAASSGASGGKKLALSSLFWHGGSVYDAWFSCASNQVAQVLLTLPYSFSQLGMASGVVFQLFYGLMGSWTAYLISVLYVEYRTRKEREKVDFRNHVIQVL